MEKKILQLKKDMIATMRECDRAEIAKEQGKTLKYLADNAYDYDFSDSYESFAWELGYIEAINDVLKIIKK